MKFIALLLVAIGCSDGSSLLETRMRCDDASGALVEGRVETSQGPLELGRVTARMRMRTGEAPQTLVITGAAELSFFFDYTDVPPVVGEYAKTASLHVESEVDMTYEANGTLFVDDRVWTDDTRCFAGRFDLDFEDGALAGRFRVP